MRCLIDRPGPPSGPWASIGSLRDVSVTTQAVADMTQTVLAPLIGPEFDKFLGASIGASQNGTTVSILSALARSDVDPWQEAAALARMPKEGAAIRLAKLIAGLSRDSLEVTPDKAFVGDLIGLLPRVASFPMALPEAAFVIGRSRGARTRFAVSALAIVVAIIFALSISPWSKEGSGARPATPSVERSTELPR